jgi:hypothetical protein
VWDLVAREIGINAADAPSGVADFHFLEEHLAHVDRAHRVRTPRRRAR